MKREEWNNSYICEYKMLKSMTTVKIHEKVYEYINQADDRIPKAVYAMLKEYENTTTQKSLLSDEQYNEMEKRLKNYKSGKGKGYTMEQVRQHVKKQLVK